MAQEYCTLIGKSLAWKPASQLLMGKTVRTIYVFVRREGKSLMLMADSQLYVFVFKKPFTLFVKLMLPVQSLFLRRYLLSMIL